VKTFDCDNCGAPVEFQPNLEQLQCPYCESVTPIPQSSEAISELDFWEFLKKSEASASTFEQETVGCQGCGAQTTFDENVVAGECPYCDSPLILNKSTKKGIKPRSLLPFKVDKQQALQKFRDWLKNLWFAPNKLKRYAMRDQINGVYVPHWTYDSDTGTSYQGQRGTYYYVTESYTTMENGRSVTKTRSVRKTRWTPASGHVSRHFDDVIVVAANSLPRSYAEALEPWDLQNLVSYSDEYLSGFRAESYQIGLAEGFDRAKELMWPSIQRDILSDIGGDTQRITSHSTDYNQITFKHILLPIWISSYRYNKKVYRFLVNARSGEVQGERPYSFWKILFFTLFCLGIAFAIFKGWEASGFN
jgi:DNA-directed RNA polymerase subunit RPC12/RpoP